MTKIKERNFYLKIREMKYVQQFIRVYFSKYPLVMAMQTKRNKTFLASK